MILEPSGPIYLSSEAAQTKFIDDIWPSIELANQSSPTHSRIFRELVIIADTKNKPFPRTPKSTPIRKQTIKLYEPEIERVYEHFSTHADLRKVAIPAEWTSESIRQYVKAVIENIMTSGQHGNFLVDPNRDLFEQGCDRCVPLGHSSSRLSLTN